MRGIPQMPQFGGQAPLIGQREAAIKQGVMQAVNSLSLQIYSQLAIRYIGSRDEHQEANQDCLQQLARDAKMAAQAYFEGIGVASFSEKPEG